MNAISRQERPVPTRRSAHGWVLWAVFLVITFALHFAAARYFLLYEDDYFHIGLPATHSPEWTFRQIVFVWEHWPQGRPAMFAMLALQGALIKATNSLWLGYLPSFLIVSGNGYLIYRLLLTRFPPKIAAVAALLAVMSCADPHKILLTHAPLQFAIMLNLAGLILYLRGRYVDAYLVAASSLFFYEISFALFAGAELFYQLRGRFQVKRLARSLSAWIGIAAIVLALRLALGEARAMEATSSLTVLWHRVLTNITWGPLYALENSYWHPLSLLAKHPDFPLLAASGFLVATAFLAVRFVFPSKSAGDGAQTALNPWIATILLLLLVFGPYGMQLGRTVFPGFMRPVTGYHLGAGVALAFGAALFLANRSLGKWVWMTTGALAFLGLVSTYQNLLIQRDYVRSGGYQAHFWSEVRRLAADAPLGSIVLVPQDRLMESEYIIGNSWGITHAWLVLFEQTSPLINWFSVPPQRPVTVFLVPPDWASHVEAGPDYHFYRLNGYTPPGFKPGEIPLVSDQFIVLEGNWEGAYRRNSDPIRLPDGKLLPKQVPAAPAEDIKVTGLGRYIFTHFRE